MTEPAEPAPPFAAYLAPFAAFMVLTTVEGKLPAAAWPWAYAAKLAVVVGALWRFRKAYPAPRREGVLAAWLLGLVMGVAWVFLAPFDLWQWAPAGLREWLAPSRQGFNPATIQDPLGRGAFVVLRLAGLALVVPLMEEIFWRGFLLRWFVDERFQLAPEGAANAAGFAAATLLFVAAHPELLAALVWALVAHVVWLRGRNLWANVAFHAGSNAALGALIFHYEAWQLW